MPDILQRAVEETGKVIGRVIAQQRHKEIGKVSCVGVAAVNTAKGVFAAMTASAKERVAQTAAAFPEGIT